ncbi:MAG: hypothetical protein SVX43_00895, partial [Cyanobacteriota bacterium]|nr:hypothetical protein [Cyanobacteriota bacterium]
NLKRTMSTTLGVYPQIERLHYQLLEGQLTVEGLTLNNPEGFVTPYFMQASRLHLKMNPLSLLSNKTELQEFSIETIDVNIEQKLTRNNAFTILSNARKQRKDALQANAIGGQKTFKLERMTIDNVTTDLNLAFGLQENPLSVDLPDMQAVQLENLTPENIQGVVLGDLIDRVVSGIMKKILVESQIEIPENILKEFQESPIFSEPLPNLLSNQQ